MLILLKKGTFYANYACHFFPMKKGPNANVIWQPKVFFERDMGIFDPILRFELFM